MPAGNPVTQSIKPNLVQTYEICTVWYQLVPDNEGDGYHWEYLGETNCHRITIVIPDSPPGNPPTSGSPPGDNPPPPSEDPCAGIGVSSVKDGKIINTVKVRLLYPGDGGFPPPAPDDPCTIPPVPEDDPCDKVNRQKANLALKSQLMDLKNKLNLNYEAGYLKLIGSSPQYLTGTPNTLSWNAPQLANLSNGSIQYMNHNHYFGNQSVSIFSEDDIKAFSQYIHYNKVADENSFTFSVTTSQGMTYSLVLNDKQKFNTFYNTYLSDAIGQDLFNGIYNSFISATNSPSVNESNFLAILKSLDMGISLLVGNANLSNWVISSYDPITNTITLKNCN